MERSIGISYKKMIKKHSALEKIIDKQGAFIIK